MFFYNNYGIRALIIYFYGMLIDMINGCIYVYLRLELIMFEDNHQ